MELRSLVQRCFPNTSKKDQLRIEYDLTNLGLEMPTLSNASATAKKGEMRITGTLPISFQGVEYHIPVAIIASTGYPEQPPQVLVTPTEDMVIKPKHPHVDVKDGQVYHPYLHDWEAESSTLVGLMQALEETFSAEPPVFARQDEVVEVDISPQQQGPVQISIGGGSGIVVQGISPHPAGAEASNKTEIIVVQTPNGNRNDDNKNDVPGWLIVGAVAVVLFFVFARSSR